MMFTGLRFPLLCMVLVALFLCFAAPSYAQFNSGFAGVVVEQSGASVPGAKIMVKTYP